MTSDRELLSFQFTLGGQIVLASGTYAGEIHDNVLRLHIHRTPFEDFLYAIISYTPLLVLKLLTPIFPRYTLPRTFILKKQKPNWDDEFENEKWPPRFGLSDVGRVTLCDQPSLQRDSDEIGRMIDAAFRALTKFGAEYGDIKLDNFHLVSGPEGGRVMIVDLESVEEMEPLRAPERAIVYSADRLFRYWKDAVESDRRDKEEELRQRSGASPKKLPWKGTGLALNAKEIRQLMELTRAFHLANSR
ncbi:hypothetical protein MFIFM68171_02012 [Madurella fahalii]|uniref:Protein kinase domain-containing protein n=1 Tax=Madurella fahalii TaxID=1157608 RepID=A0ABQ0G230_9PEZI